MNFKLVFLALTFLSFLNISIAQNSFYYHNGKKVFLTELADLRTINLNSGSGTLEIPEGFEKLLGNYYRISSEENLEGLSEDYLISKVFTGPLGRDTLYESNEIVLKFKPSTSTQQRSNIESTYNLTLIRESNLYTLYSTDSALSYSSKIYETGLVQYAHPNFLLKVKLASHIPNDPYFNKQYYLHNTGQIINDSMAGIADADMDLPEAWDITKGDSNLVIAVLDDGVDSLHPDLPLSRQVRLVGGNVAYKYDTTISSSLGNGSHGTNCAGIIAASQDNNIGISGVAPNTKIMPVKFIGGIAYSNPTIYADAFNFADTNGAKILSCSFSITSPGLPFGVVDSAINNIIANDKTVIVASGNTRNLNPISAPGVPFVPYDTVVEYPASHPNENLICVGASTKINKQAVYSPFSEHIDIVAPSSPSVGSTKTDSLIDGLLDAWTFGFNRLNLKLANGAFINDTTPDFGPDSNRFTGRFGGTSAATPMVAGVAALVLSVNPCLGNGQVKDILLNTADKVGPYNYNWSSKKPGHSLELGYGKVNAHQAVLAAQAFQSTSLDLMIKDVPRDFGYEPDTIAKFLYLSEDIWVRNSPNGLTEQYHENPEYDPNNPVYVYVRVRNKSCADASVNDSVVLYWSKAATALAWPNHWNGTMTSPVLMGDSIATLSVGNLKAGRDTILSFSWNPPNPSNYIGLVPQPWHFCLLARIVSSNDPMTTAEVSTLWQNVKNNNNIAWKNISIVNKSNIVLSEPQLGLGAAVAIGNDKEEGNKTIQLDFFESTDDFGNPLYDDAEITIKLDQAATQIWENGGFNSNGLSYQGNGEFLVTSANANLSNMTFNTGERAYIYIGFNFLTQEVADKVVYKYHVEQYEDGENDEFIGGEQYLIHRDERDLFAAEAGYDENLELGQSLRLQANDIGEAATYKWYNENGELIYQGKDTTFIPTENTIYTLEVIAHKDGFKDYDEKKVQIKEYYITSIYPNPTTSQNAITIEYEASKASAAYIKISSTSQTVSSNYIINPNQTQQQINISALNAGSYIVTLVCDGVIRDSKTLTKN